MGPPGERPVLASTKITVANGAAKTRILVDFPVGHYRIDFDYADGTAGEPVTFSVFSSEKAALPTGVLYQLTAREKPVVPGDPIVLKLISAVDLPLVLNTWASRRGVEFGRTQAERAATFTYTPTEADRGGIAFDLAFIALNDSHRERRALALPWDNKELKITYTTFRDKLRTRRTGKMDGQRRQRRRHARAGRRPGHDVRRQPRPDL